MYLTQYGEKVTYSSNVVLSQYQWHKIVLIWIKCIYYNYQGSLVASLNHTKLKYIVEDQ